MIPCFCVASIRGSWRTRADAFIRSENILITHGVAVTCDCAVKLELQKFAIRPPYIESVTFLRTSK